MARKKSYAVPGRYRSVEINPAVCNGCNRCIKVCPMDVMAAGSRKGRPPKVVYPDECWFCGCCVEMCPLGGQGAIRVVIPLPMRVSVLQGAPRELAVHDRDGNQ